MVRHQHDQYRLRVAGLCTGVSHRQCPWQPGSVIFTWRCSTTLCDFNLNTFYTGVTDSFLFFFATGVVVANSITFRAFLFGSFILKDVTWGYFVVFFPGKWIKRKKTYPSLAPVHRQTMAGLVAIVTLLHAFFLPLSESNFCLKRHFLVFKGLKGIIVTGVNLCLCISFYAAETVVEVANRESDTKNRFSP